jgi:pimeloyl-ACP methyl ester carboxylesterase
LMNSSQIVQERIYKAPSTLSMLLEFTALAEIPSFFALRRLLARVLPHGDGHPVLVMPGFMAGDGSTASLRGLLKKIGYEPYSWSLGRNPGLCENVNRKVQDRVVDIASRSGRKVSLIGWSAGGIYARLAAHHQTDSVRQVITLGSPFGIDYRHDIGSAIGKLYSLSKDELNTEPMIESGLMSRPPPVPSTSIVSKRDGMAYWKFSLDVSDHHTENIFAPGSHCGMTHNPLMSILIADRLAQPEGRWKPFSPKLYNRKFFKPTCAKRNIPQWIKYE